MMLCPRCNEPFVEDFREAKPATLAPIRRRYKLCPDCRPTGGEKTRVPEDCVTHMGAARLGCRLLEAWRMEHGEAN